MLILTIFIGAAFVGFTTGNVIAQEVKIGDTSGSPFVSFEDAMFSGMYEIRLSDGTGQFEIRDMTNDRTVLIIDNGNVGVGDAASTVQDFTIACNTGVCNIQTRALNGTAQNTVTSLGGDGTAKFKLRDDVTSVGKIQFQIVINDDGTVCLGETGGVGCMLIFDIKGPNPGQVQEANGNCIANCS